VFPDYLQFCITAPTDLCNVGCCYVWRSMKMLLSPKPGIFKFEPLSIKPAANKDLLKLLKHYEELRHCHYKSSSEQLPVYCRPWL